MITVETCQLAGSEVLHACPQQAMDNPLPCVVFYHGFTSSKLVYSYFAVALAQAGLRVIMPDAVDHGSRFDGDENLRMQRFWPILLQNMAEFPALRKAIIAQGWLQDNRLAVAGASMGGMTALGIMAHHPDLKSAVSLMGSGYFTDLSQTLYPSHFTNTEQLAQWEISHRLEALASRPLLLWHGDQDDVVPVTQTQRLESALKENGLASLLSCIYQKGVRHRITPEALAATVAFLQKTL
ncbi:esterase [Enterobacteriaceae bacterium ESL0689]|nr:esterase [Enterobacteriaceae bacterium ESL0689]